MYFIVAALINNFPFYIPKCKKKNINENLRFYSFFLLFIQLLVIKCEAKPQNGINYVIVFNHFSDLNISR